MKKSTIIVINEKFLYSFNTAKNKPKGKELKKNVLTQHFGKLLNNKFIENIYSGVDYFFLLNSFIRVINYFTTVLV